MGFCFLHFLKVFPFVSRTAVQTVGQFQNRFVCFRVGIAISGHSGAGLCRVRRRSLAVDDVNPQERADEEPRQKFSFLEM
jgi:hypothetical protein